MYINRHKLFFLPDSGSCKVAEDLRNLIPQCNDFFSEKYQDQQDYSAGWKMVSASHRDNLLPWQYFTGTEANNSIPIWGHLGTYPGGGYLIQLPYKLEDATSLFDSLGNHNWLNEYSRALILEITVYVPSMNLAAVIVFIFEVMPNGSFLTRYDMGIFKLYRYVDLSQLVYLVCEGIVLFYILHTIWHEIKKVYSKHLKYFKNLLHWNQLVFIVAGACIICFYILRDQYLKKQLMYWSKNKSHYINFYQVAVFDELIVYMLAVMQLSAVLQLIQFLSFQTGITIVIRTLITAARDLAGFYSFVGIWIIAFGSLAFLKFSSSIEDFSTLTSTMRSLLSLLLGDLNYEGEYRNSPIYMPLFMFAYICIMYLVIVNIFISIIQRSHSTTNRMYRNVKSRYEFAQYLRELAFNTLKIIPDVSVEVPQEESPDRDFDDGSDIEEVISSLCTGSENYKTLFKNLTKRLKKTLNLVYIDTFVDDLILLDYLLRDAINLLHSNKKAVAVTEDEWNNSESLLMSHQEGSLNRIIVSVSDFQYTTSCFGAACRVANDNHENNTGLIPDVAVDASLTHSLKNRLHLTDSDNNTQDFCETPCHSSGNDALSITNAGPEIGAHSVFNNATSRSSSLSPENKSSLKAEAHPEIQARSIFDSVKCQSQGPSFDNKSHLMTDVSRKTTKIPKIIVSMYDWQETGSCLSGDCRVPNDNQENKTGLKSDVCAN